MSTEWQDIILSAGKSKKRGAVSLSGTGIAESKFIFAGGKLPKPIEIKLDDILFLYWMEIGRGGVSDGGFVVKIALKGNSFVKFSGFPANAYNPIQNWLVASEKELILEKVSTRGANWGHLKVSDHRMVYEDKDEMVIWDMPITQVSQTVFQGKQEIAVEFQNDDDPKSVMSQLETLCEIRIFVPNEDRPDGAAASSSAAAASSVPKVKTEGEDGEEKKDGEEGEEDAEPEEEETAAQLLVKDIMSRIGIDDKAVQPIARFNLMFQSPRGRYQVDMFSSYMKMWSKTFQYKILYKFINKMFMFYCPAQTCYFFVVGLNPPVRQGRTSHPFLLVQIDSLEMSEQTFNVDEKTCQEQYQNVIQPTMKGATFDIITRVFKALTEKKVLSGGSFRSYKRPGDETESGACIRCNWKANDGYLYCMEKSFFFVRKPMMHIRHVDITELSFERLSNSSTGSKSFDLRIVTNEEKNNEYVFSGIAREEYQGLFDFLKNKKLNMTSQFEGSMTTTGATGRVRLAANYDEENDPHMNRIQAEAEDSDEEGDSDFEGGSSSSESADENDSNPEVDEDDIPTKKTKKKKSAGSDDDEEPAAKKKGQKRKRGEDKEKKQKKLAKSAYFFYRDVAQPKFIAEHPEMATDSIAVSTALADQWKELDAESKKIYDDMHAEAQAKIDSEYEAESAPKKSKSKSKSSRGKGGKPKQPPKPQTLWQEKRKPKLKAEEPSLTAQEVKTRLAEEWKAMSEEDQQEWVEKQLAMKKQYKLDLAEWEKNHPKEDEEMKEADDSGGEEAGGDDESGGKSKRSKEEKKQRKAEKEAKKAARKAEKEKSGKKSKKKKKDKGDASGGDDDAEMEEAEPTVKAEPMEE